MSANHRGGRSECWSKEHFERVGAACELKWKCKACGKTISAQSGTRLKEHLNACDKIDETTKEKCKSELSKNEEARAKRKRTTSTLQQSVLAVDRMNDSDYDNINKRLADFFYATNTPFSHVEHPLFLEFVKALRPMIDTSKLVNRKKLAGELLDKAYEEYIVPARKNAETAEYVSLHMDAWQTDKKDHVLSIHACSPQPLLLQTDIMEKRSHTWEEHKDHLDRLPKMRVVAVVSDKESAGHKAAKEFCRTHPDAEGELVCTPHTLNRFVNDVIGTHTVNKKEVGNPYNYVNSTVSQVVSCIRNVELARKLYTSALQERKLPVKLPPTPCETRWTSWRASYTEIYEKKGVLINLINAEDNTAARQWCNSVPASSQLVDKSFFLVFSSILCLLTEVDKAVKTLEADPSRIGFILPCMQKLRSHVVDLKTKLLTDITELKLPNWKTEKAAHDKNFDVIIASLDARMKQYEVKWVQAATMMSPFVHSPGEQHKELMECFTAEKLAALRKDTHEYLKVKYPEPELQAKALAELVEFETRTGIYDNAGLWSLAKTKPPEAWWNAIKTMHPKSLLAPIGKKITMVVPHACQCERAFSVMGWMSGGKRCRLNSERVHKLACVYYKLSANYKNRNQDTWWDALDEVGPKKNTKATITPQAIDYTQIM